MMLSLLLFFASAGRSVAEDPSKWLLCETSVFKPPIVPGAKVLSIIAEEKRNYSTPTLGSTTLSASNIDFCDVKVFLNHPGTDDRVLVQTWLPLAREDWNGRFQAVGGYGYATGAFEYMLGPALQSRYAASSTDGGHEQRSIVDMSWALHADKSVNWDLVHNFATRSLADQVHVGKSVAEQFFGVKPHHSYWNGCSQGGRQGYVVAQRFPGLVDGIMANAPALKMPGVPLAEFWPQVVMKEAGVLLSNCEFDWFKDQALEECDLLDGVRDGVIVDPQACPFNPSTLIGKEFQCDGQGVKVTSTMADIIRKIRDGPRTPFGERLWSGFPYGASTRYTTNITITKEGHRALNPSPIANAWIRFTLRDTSFNTSTLTYADYMALWAQSNELYGWAFNADNADLSAFRNAGGKLLTWHGIDDDYIPYQTTVDYRKRVGRELGENAVDEFYRLFLAPGVMHCGFGVGPLPNQPLEQLVNWVEKGDLPETLDAETMDKEGDLVTRSLCRYPKKLKYMGVGDAKRASSWSCEGEEEEEEDSLIGSGGGFLGGFKARLMELGMGLKIEG